MLDDQNRSGVATETFRAKTCRINRFGSVKQARLTPIRSNNNSLIFPFRRHVVARGRVPVVERHSVRNACWRRSGNGTDVVVLASTRNRKGIGDFVAHDIWRNAMTGHRGIVCRVEALVVNVDSNQRDPVRTCCRVNERLIRDGLRLQVTSVVTDVVYWVVRCDPFDGAIFGPLL